MGKTGRFFVLFALCFFALGVNFVSAQTEAERAAGSKKFLAALQEKFPGSEFQRNVHLMMSLPIQEVLIKNVPGHDTGMSFNVTNIARADNVTIYGNGLDFSSDFYKWNIPKEYYGQAFPKGDKTIGTILNLSGSSVDPDSQYLGIFYDSSFIDREKAKKKEYTDKDFFGDPVKILSDKRNNGTSFGYADGSFDNFPVSKLVQIYKMPTLADHFKHPGAPEDQGLPSKKIVKYTLGSGLKTSDIYKELVVEFPGLRILDAEVEYCFSNDKDDSEWYIICTINDSLFLVRDVFFP